MSDPSNIEPDSIKNLELNASQLPLKDLSKSKEELSKGFPQKIQVDQRELRESFSPKNRSSLDREEIKRLVKEAIDEKLDEIKKIVKQAIDEKFDNT